jgi:hypothetical protein
MACGAICESFPILAPKARSRIAREKRQPTYMFSEKQYIKSLPAWQDIVDFS